jgi:hypothetical protein
MPDVILGRDYQTDHIIRLDDIERRSGLYILGRMGRGKTSLITKLIEQDMEHGHGVFFLDPHGDAVEELLTRIPSHRTDDVIVLDPSDERYSFGVNPLACPDPNNMTQRSGTYAQAIAIFKKLFANIQTDELDILLNQYLRNSFFPLIANQGYTLLEISLLLEEKPFRDRLLENPSVRREVRDFWHKTFDQLRSDKQREEIASTQRRLDQFQDYDEIRHIVGQSTNTIDFGTIMRGRKILFVKLKKTLPGDAWRIIGTMLVSNLVHAVRQREHLPESERHQFCIFVDEFQNFASSDDFAVLFTEARKYGIATTIAHQERYGQFADNKKISGATDAAVIKIFFQPTPHDAEEQAVEFAVRATPTEIHREAELVFSPHPVEDLWEKGHPDAQLMQIRSRWFWIAQLLRQNPQDNYFLFDPGRIARETLEGNSITFALRDLDDWDWYRSSVEMVRQGITLLNRYYYDCMAGRFDPTRELIDTQVQLMLKIMECLGGVLGFLPMRPVIPAPKRMRLVYLMNEKLKDDFDQKKRERMQSLRDEIQYLKDHGVKEERWGSETVGSSSGSSSGSSFGASTGPGATHGASSSRSYSYSTSSSSSHSRSTPILRYVGGTEEGFKKQERYRKSLWQEIQALEHTQPPVLQRMLSSPLSPQDLHEIRSIAIQAGMPMHEVEQLIEWEEYSLTRLETDALATWVRLRANPKVGLAQFQRDAPPAYTASKTAMATRLPLPGYLAEPRLSWQIKELQLYIGSCFYHVPRMLAQQPMKVPSGKYVETLKVERTQQDLNNDMVQELLDLQPHTAYVKSAGWKGKIQTVVVDKAAAALLSTGRRELVDVRGSVQQKAIDDRILRKRSDIEGEILERHGNWRRRPGNDAPPPRHTDEANSSALPAGQGGGDLVQTLTPSQAVEISDQAPSTPALPLQFESLRFYESGTDIGENKERQYSAQFPQQSARFIKFELRVKNLERQIDRAHQLMYRYYNPDGTLLGGSQNTWVVKSTSAKPSYSWGWGWAEPGHWHPGAYRVDILIDGMKCAEETFTITRFEEPPPAPSFIQEKSPTAMFCGQCGQQLPDAANFCFKCGTATCIDIPAQTPALELASLRFFASGKGMPAQKKRRYATSFPKRTARFINFELTLRNNLSRQDSERHLLTIYYYNPDGSQLWVGRDDEWVVNIEEAQPSYSWGWGWAEPGWWYIGRHRVEILIDGVEIGEDYFTITGRKSGKKPSLALEVSPLLLEGHISGQTREEHPSGSAKVGHLVTAPESDKAQITVQEEPGGEEREGLLYVPFSEKLRAHARQHLQACEAKGNWWGAAYAVLALKDKEAARRVLPQVQANHPDLRTDIEELMALVGDDLETVEQLIQTYNNQYFGRARAIVLALSLADKTTAKRLLHELETTTRDQWEFSFKIQWIQTLARKLGDSDAIKRLLERLERKEVYEVAHFDPRHMRLNPELGKRLMHKALEAKGTGITPDIYCVQQAGMIAAVLGETNIATECFNHCLREKQYRFAGRIAALGGDVSAAETIILELIKGRHTSHAQEVIALLAPHSPEVAYRLLHTLAEHGEDIGESAVWILKFHPE